MKISLSNLRMFIVMTCILLTVAFFHPQKSEAAEFAYGADIGWLQQMEANGYAFKNSSGIQKDLITILQEKGVNSIRLRVWVNPSDSPTAGHNSIDEVAIMAKRVKDAGFRVLIDFHFSDSWVSVGYQAPPVAWKNYNYAQMQVALRDYVYNSMNVLKSKGVYPDWVQIGNEENNGILGAVGSSIYQPAQMTGLLNIAYDNVKLVSPNTLVAIHLAQPQYSDRITKWFDTYKSYGGKWDVTAFSSYADYTNAISIATTIDSYRTRYGKPVMLVEMGGAVSKADAVQRTVAYYTTRIKGMGGLGAFYWEPEGYAPFTDYQMGAWDSTTQMPTNAMNGFLSAGAVPWGGNGFVRLKNLGTGLDIDGMGLTAAGSTAGQYSDSGNYNQYWSIINVAGGYIRLKNRTTGLFLDGMGSTANGSVVAEWTSGNSYNQQWQVISVDGYTKFKNRATGLFIDGGGLTANGSNLLQYADGTSSNQRWKIVN